MGGLLHDHKRASGRDIREVFVLGYVRILRYDETIVVLTWLMLAIDEEYSTYGRYETFTGAMEGWNWS